MKITCQFIVALAAGLALSSAALAQTKDNPPTSPGRAPPATSSTADDDGTNPLTRAGENYSPTGRAPGGQELRNGGAAPDSTAAREPPVINGNGTAGQGN
jgi:hypothetical protein